MMPTTLARAVAAITLSASMLFAASAGRADVTKPGSTGSTKNKTHHPPLYGPGSSHNPIVRHPPLHGPGSSHNPIVVTKDCNDPNTLCRRP
jgi:hypothetical protein